MTPLLRNHPQPARGALLGGLCQEKTTPEELPASPPAGPSGASAVVALQKPHPVSPVPAESWGGLGWSCTAPEPGKGSRARAGHGEGWNTPLWPPQLGTNLPEDLGLIICFLKAQEDFLYIYIIYIYIWAVAVLATQNTRILSCLVSCRFQGFPPPESQKLLWEMLSCLHRFFL